MSLVPGYPSSILKTQSSADPGVVLQAFRTLGPGAQAQAKTLVQDLEERRGRREDRIVSRMEALTSAIAEKLEPASSKALNQHLSDLGAECDRMCGLGNGLLKGEEGLVAERAIVETHRIEEAAESRESLLRRLAEQQKEDDESLAARAAELA